MEKVFRDYLRKGFKKAMKQLAPEFREVKYSEEFGGDIAGSQVFDWLVGDSVHILVALQFVRGRSYVPLRVYWSTSGAVPRIVEGQKNALAIRQAAREKGRETKLEDYLESPEIMLDSSDFAASLTSFAMANEFPPRERIRPIMLRPESQRLLKEIDPQFAGNGWEGQLGTDDWYSIISYGNEALTEADAEYAVGGTLESVSAFMQTHCLPFLRKAAPKLLDSARRMHHR